MTNNNSGSQGSLPNLPVQIGKMRPTSLFVQGKSSQQLLGIPQDCGTPYIQNNIPNLDIVKNVGRAKGTLVTYSPDSAYNYLSPSDRYEDSLYLIIAYVQTDDTTGVTTYGFCSNDSPTGFWEVTSGGTSEATYAYFDQNFLTILCPTPFYINDLDPLNTDSKVFSWTQISGSRTVIIDPPNIANPLITIETSCYQGNCDPSTNDPIRLRVNTDNPLVFADLIILNRAIENWDGLGFMGNNDVPDCLKILAVYVAPVSIQEAYVWTGNPLAITWIPPTCETQFITDYRLQILTPPYTDSEIFSPNANKIASINANQRYRIAANYNIYGNIFTTYSQPISVIYDPTLPIQSIFADDSCKNLGLVNTGDTYVVTNFGFQIRNISESDNLGLGYANTGNSYVVTNFGVQVRFLTESDNLGLGYMQVPDSYVVTDLGGIIVG